MSTSQDGRTPRRTTRRSTATPVRDVSPPAHNTRATSTAVQGTPATRRSGRGSSRRPDQARDVTGSNALPEIHTRQSYAYGSSKTPLLPEQLNVRDKLTLRQVADQMDDAVNRAEQNLATHGTDLDQSKTQPRPQIQNTRERANQRGSKEPSPPASVTTDFQKKQRTAAWASSLESGQLEDIPEEEQPQVDTPETRRTEPSSFPSGVFDQSYQYERGVRPPRRPPGPKRKSLGAQLGTQLGSLLDQIIAKANSMRKASVSFAQAVGRWFQRLFNSVSSTLFELPESRLVSNLTKCFFILVMMGFMSYVLCFGYRNFLCNPLSTSSFAQTMESWCGTCQSSRSYIDLPPNSEIDISKLTVALKQINAQIRDIETRLTSRLDTKVSVIHTDIESLRKEQSSIIQQLENVANHASHQSSSVDVASPLIPKVNYFSPANGAIVNVQITSPTRQAPIALPLRLMTRMLGIRKYKAHNPVTALEPWQDVGDCWCAAATASGQDSVRLGVGVREYIFPTELVIEHPPREITLMPETAPRHVELWADLGHLNDQEWKDLGVDAMTQDRDTGRNPFGTTWAMIASVEYDLAAHANHLQRFALDVNQFGEMKYSAMDYAVRVRSNYGGEYGCLYRVRLHGVPVEKHEDVLESAARNDI